MDTTLQLSNLFLLHDHSSSQRHERRANHIDLIYDEAQLIQMLE